jgi:hypothetical protein
MAYVPPPTNQPPPRKQMGTFGAVFWGVLLANIVTVMVFAMMVSAEGNGL